MKRTLLFIAVTLYACLGAASQTALRSESVSSPENVKIFNGRLTDASSNKRIPYATVWMRGTSISVVSNGDGDFSLKIPADYPTDSIYIKHIGYGQKTILMSPDPEKRMNISLNEASTMIPGITVRSGDPWRIVMGAIHNIRNNYPAKPQRLVGFYRELIKKNNRYVSVVEAIPDIYKAPTANMFGDQIRLYKGRRSYDSSRIDTLIMKYQGGLTTALELDIAKRYDIVFIHLDSIRYEYDLKLEEPTEIQDRPQYVISFDQKDGDKKQMLYRGKLYIDMESLAISRAEYNMNVEEHPDAYKAFIVSLPSRYRVAVLSTKVVIDYKYNNGIWDYNYSSAEIVMRVRSDRRKFNADYTVTSELVITDRSDINIEKFPSKERLRTNDMVFDKIIDYDDSGFWEGYNAIEPEQTIESAVRRLNRNIDMQNIK